MGCDYNFWIYVVTNKNHSVLYIGVTNSLSRRTWQHRGADVLQDRLFQEISRLRSK
ncbi:MAG: GIY-YIG nuclease family protein [Candidatus Udaeobacter sp.]